MTAALDITCNSSLTLAGTAIAGGGGGGGDNSKGAGPSSAALLAAGAGVTRPARYKVLVIFTGDRQAHWVGKGGGGMGLEYLLKLFEPVSF